jgi:hypothetical protein
MSTRSEAGPGSEAIQFVNSAWRMRKLLLWAEAVIGLPLMLAGFILTRSAPDSPVALLLILAPFIVALPMVFHRLAIFRKRPRSVVLWVRRFHRGKRSAAEQLLLEFAVTDWGQLVTLADESVDTDAATRMMSTWKYVVVALVVGGIMIIAVAKAGVGVFAGFAIALVIFLRRRTKKNRVNLPDKATEVSQIVARIRAQKLPSSASVVLTCYVIVSYGGRLSWIFRKPSMRQSFPLQKILPTWTGRSRTSAAHWEPTSLFCSWTRKTELIRCLQRWQRSRSLRCQTRCVGGLVCGRGGMLKSLLVLQFWRAGRRLPVLLNTSGAIRNLMPPSLSCGNQ